MMADLTPVLSEGESDLLAQQESIIEQGLNTFVEVGTALMVIRDQRLYREGFGNFEEYCQVNWGFSRQRSHQMIDAARVVGALSTMVDVPLPTSERQARELVDLAPETAAAVMETAAESGRLTAAAIRDAREVHGVTKVTQTTKTETVVDSETGEILDGPRLAVEYIEPSAFAKSMVAENLAAVMAGTPEEQRRSNLTREFFKSLDAISRIHILPAEELAEVLSPEYMASLEQQAKHFNNWMDTIRRTRHRGLRLIEGEVQ